MFSPPHSNALTRPPEPSSTLPHESADLDSTKSSTRLGGGPGMLVVVGAAVGVVVVVVVVGTQAPFAWQPSPTLVGFVSGHVVPPFLAHFPAFTTLLALPPFFVLQQTTKPLRPHVDCRMKRFTNSFLQAPLSLEPTAFFAAFMYLPRLVALAHGAAASTASITAANPDVSVHFLAAFAAGAATSAASSTRELRPMIPMKHSFFGFRCIHPPGAGSAEFSPHDFNPLHRP